MNKKLPIKILVLLVVVIFLSIDKNNLFGPQKTMNEPTIKGAIEMSEIEIPEGLVKLKKDTILSNDFKISAYTYLNKDKVYHIAKTPASLTKNIYRDFSTDLRVFYRNQLVVEKCIDKRLFQNEQDADFWQKSIMKSVEINEFKSMEQSVVIHVSFYNPVSKRFRDYNLSIDRKGTIQTQMI